MNILLTGISKGLGLEIAKQLLSKNHTVFGISRTMSTELKELIDKFPSKLFHLAYDLENTNDKREVIFKNYLKDIAIDSYINNAAMAYDTLLTNMDASLVQKMININQLSPMLMTKYAIRNMLLHDIKGSILHVSSISVHTGYKGLSMYAATKGALEAFSKNTAREWGVKGIRSNCVVVGFMETDMTSQMTEEMKQKIYKRNSIKDAVSIGSVASTICYLISDEAASITGQNVFVDNGTI